MPKFVVASYSSKGACHPVAMGVIRLYGRGSPV